MTPLRTIRHKLTLVNQGRYRQQVTRKPRDRHIGDLITLVEAARRLQMSREGLHKAAERGQILGADIGHNGRAVWVFRRVVIERERESRIAAGKITDDAT